MTTPSLEQQISNLSSKLSETLEHKQREDKFAIEANERFSKNLACFEKYYQEIAQAIKDYQTRDDFCIHVTSTGHGNFFPKNIDAPIYSDDPIAQTQEQIEVQTTHAVYSLTDYTGYPQDDMDTRIHSRYMTALTRHMCDVRTENKSSIKVLPDSFPTAIIFGIGLGYHVPLLLKRTHFDYVYLIEPEFEQFFASLFCTDWFEIIETVDEQGGCLFFHLGIDHKSFMDDIEKISEDVGAFSLVRSFCYQHTPGQTLNTLIQKWCSDYFRFQFGHGFYNDAVTGLAHSIHHLRNNAAILSKSPTGLDFDTPIFIVGNGPSLDSAEEFLKNNQQNAIIIAIGTSIASLHNKGIQTDFHVLVERPYSNYKIFGDILPSEEYQKVNLLGLNTLYPDTTKRYKWAGIAAKGSESGTCLLNLLSQIHLSQGLPLIPYCNPVVANAALSFMLFMGFRNVYLFGIDNGSQPCGTHHSKDSIYSQSEEDGSEGYLSLKFDGKALEGNLGSYVISNDLYIVAHAQLERLISHYNATSCMNVGHGAKIQGAIATPTDNLIDLKKPLDKVSVIESIKQGFFEELPLDDVEEKFIAVDKLQDVCEHVLAISREDVDSRKVASEQLRRQARFIYSLRDTSLAHLFHIIKGALLYYHCPMITLLYQYDDEAFCLEKYSELNLLWQQYVEEIRDDYAMNYDRTCDLGKEI
ncbi:6-hydroxymethylpterin diphosphokinase MptE-like protein [Pseudoalteromonas sp. MMG012]|uniref:motility associated factor glycosyltransferase family protein n=1 Tax=Pseudoalteromonas sp. MMG012 TaxID=2822686 RepID=UPI001B39CEF4|nr:6-hydroxymethylpterin diphosphokinase MptE-like protein [Pseudoalteromonas sp. MMG012]MBQ4848670.1 motility associated factor glycosyltransferase family protein [Pseudoalteromonas sp. MMG012]